MPNQLLNRIEYLSFLNKKKSYNEKASEFQCKNHTPTHKIDKTNTITHTYLSYKFYN